MKLYKSILTLTLLLCAIGKSWGETVTLDAKDGNIEYYNGKTIDITIKNRTYQANCWVVVCYPFDVTKAMLDANFTSGYAVEEYSSMSADGKFTFTVLDLASKSIPAGTPFLLKSKVEVNTVAFNNVTINTTLHNVTHTNGRYSGTLHGCYSKPALWQFQNGNTYSGCLFISAQETLTGPYSSPLNDDTDVLRFTNGFFSFSSGVSTTLSIGSINNDSNEGSGGTITDDDPNADYSHQNDANGDGVLEPDATNPAFGVKINYNRYPQKTDVPTIYITTDADQDITNLYTTKTETYYTANIVVVDKNGKMKQRNEAVTFRGRGNSTWNSGSKKKPWRLKFPSKTKFLAEYDLSAGAEINNYANAKSWTLMSNVYDKSLMRNALTAELGKRYGLEFCPAYRFVDLVINGQYLGTYQVSDQVQVDPKRVNVNSKTGWFVEHSTLNFAEDPYIMPNASGQNLYVTVKNPETETVTASGESTEAKEGGAYYGIKQWLTQYWTSLTGAQYSSEADKYKAWRDQTNLKSLIGWFIIEDLAGNYDGGMANVYAYKEAAASKLKFGPLWDLDIAYGNYSQLTNTHFWNAQTQGIGFLFGEMFKDKYFVKALYEKWTEFKNGDELKNFINSKVTEIAAILTNTQAANYNTTGDSFRNGDAGWTLSSSVSWCTKGVNSFDEATSALTSYLLNTTNGRISWIETEYKKQYDALDCALLEDINIDDDGDTDGDEGGEGTGNTNISPEEIAAKIANKQQLTNLPTIYLTVPDAEGVNINTILDEKKEYHSASIKVVDNGTDGTGKRLESFEDDVLRIKVRGNETAKGTKKPYRLNFGKDTTAEDGTVTSHKHDMLGLGYKKRNWVLLANQKDGTLMHNALAYTIGNSVGMEFCPGYKFVDLVINGEYRGNYMISDHCEVGKNRINVDEDAGWYLEANGNNQWEAPFVNPTGLYVSIKSPEPDANSAEEDVLKQDVLTYFNSWTSLFDRYDQNPLSKEKIARLIDPQTGWRKYLDEESLINYYIGVNVTGNHDGFMTVKMYRNPEEKIKFGPLWDFDTSYGQYDDGKTLSEDAQPGSPIYCDYIHKLVQYDTVFVKKIHDKLHAVATPLKSAMLTEVNTLEKRLATSQSLENPNQQSGAYATSVQGLRDYIDTHFTWLLETIDAKYEAMGGDDIVIPDNSDDDDTPVGDLGALKDLGEGKYSYTGSASTFKEGTEITITTSSAGTTLSNYITEETAWNTDKTITLTADDVTALANSENKYTFFMKATGGEVKAVNVKVPSEAGTLKYVGNNTYWGNGEEVYKYTGSAETLKAGNTIKIVMPEDGAYCNVYSDNQYTQHFGTDKWKPIYTITKEDADRFANCNYTITILVYNGTCESVEISGGSSETPTTPTYTLALSASEGGTVSGAGTYNEGTTVLIKAIPNAGYKFVKWSDDNTHAVRSVSLTDADITLSATFVSNETPTEHAQLTNLPTIYLNAATIGNEWAGATLEVFDKDNKLTQGTEWTNSAVEVQYQGSGDNTSKNSYRLKFGSKTKLLASGKFKQWVLLANDDDPTMINNALAKVLGDAIGMPWTPGYEFVDLYVNDKYMGTYQVTDRIKAEEGRSLVTGGNKDNDWQVRFNDNNELQEDGTSDYITANGINVIYKNPDPSDLTAEQVNTLRTDMSEYFGDVFTKSGDTYPNFAENINKQQLIQWYIAQELLGVYKGFSSIEAYRSITATAADNLLHFGPLWDSEKGFGNTGSAPAIDMSDLNTKDSYKGLMTKYAAFDKMKDIFTWLWTEDWFKSGVKATWTSLYTDKKIASLLKSKANELSTLLAESQTKNLTTWPNSLEYNSSTSSKYESYSDAITALNTFIDKRVEYLNTKFEELTAEACNHTYNDGKYVANADATHSPKCDKCDFVDTAVKEAHTLVAKDNKPYCEVCSFSEEASIIGGATNDTPVYRIHESEKPTDVKYISANSNVAANGNKIYISDQPITGTSSLTNIVWPRSEDGQYVAKNITFTDGSYKYDQKINIHAEEVTYTRSMTSSWGTVCLPFKIASCDDYTLYEISRAYVNEEDNTGTLIFEKINSASGLQPVVFKKNTSDSEVIFRGVPQNKGDIDDGLVTVKKSKKFGNEDAIFSTDVQSSGTWTLYGDVKQDVTFNVSEYVGKEIYYIASNKFWHATGDVNMKTFRAAFVFTPAYHGTDTEAAKSFSISIDDNSATSISKMNIKNHLAIFIESDGITISSDKPAQVTISTIGGSTVNRITLKADEQRHVSLPKGLYVINNTKVSVK